MAQQLGILQVSSVYRTALAILGLSWFHINLSSICSSSVKNVIGILTGTALNLQTALGLQIILLSYSNQNSMVKKTKPNQTKPAWYLYKNMTDRHTDRKYRIKSPELNPHTYSQLILDKGGENTQWRKEGLSSKRHQESWAATCQSVMLEHTLTPQTNKPKKPSQIVSKTSLYKT